METPTPLEQAFAAMREAFPEHYVSAHLTIDQSRFSDTSSCFYRVAVVIGSDCFSGQDADAMIAVEKCILDRAKNDPLAKARKILESAGFAVTQSPESNTKQNEK